MSSIPTRYKAYTYESLGKVEDILKLNEVPTTPLPSSHVRIQVHSAALNPIDFKIPELYGALFTGSEPSVDKPFRIGFDVAGVVVEIGSAVTDFHVGDQVHAMAAKTTIGSLAEYVSTEAEYLAHKPKTTDFDHAAAVPLASLTTYQAIKNHAKLQFGEQILILGGSTATGIFAIQYAKALGAFVIATTSAKNVAFVNSLGADQVIDYTQEKKWGAVLEPHSVDVILDCSVEPESWEDAAQIVLKKQTGRFVTLKRGLSHSPAKYGASYTDIMTNSSGQDLAAITKLIDGGQVKSVIDSVFTFDKVTQAFTKLKTGRAVGKIVVKVL